MPYLLVTGATGLVGRYLLRDLFARDCRIAVVVRPTRGQTATQRVESIMRQWERERGYALPRPIVLEGDLTQPGLGLDDRDVDWLAEHCDTVLHSAASLAFVAEPKTGEPQRTNIEGTRNLLGVCLEAGIRKFHHVSTAYVCGLRDDRVLESDVDVGQQNCNPYESSKLAAEKMIRSAEHLDEVTVYRPSSVLGDSKTGYTSTTHGFYLPLQLAFNSAKVFPVDQIDDRFMALLGLKGSERQNMVPVDWVSEVIATILMRPEEHGQTYHLTHPRAVSVRLMREVIQAAIAELPESTAPLTTDEAVVESLLDRFTELMGTYQSYFRDDPEFDRTNLESAVGELPLPDVDYDFLLRMSRYPIRHKFAPKRELVTDDQLIGNDFAARLKRRAPSDDRVEQKEVECGVQINGRGGGQWTLRTGGNEPQVTPGLPVDATDLIYLNASVYESLLNESTTMADAISRSQLVLEFESATGRAAATKQFERLLAVARHSRGPLQSGDSEVTGSVTPSVAGDRVGARSSLSHTSKRVRD